MQQLVNGVDVLEVVITPVHLFYVFAQRCTPAVKQELNRFLTTLMKAVALQGHAVKSDALASQCLCGRLTIVIHVGWVAK